MAKQVEDNGLLEDVSLDDELEGFLNGTGGAVQLEPRPMSLGNTLDEEASQSSTAASSSGSGSAAAAVGAAATAAAATAGAAASALIGGDFAVAHGIMGDAAAKAVGNMAAVAVPTSLQPVTERAGKFVNKAQPWREFFLPLSPPTAADGFSRLTANLYNFQTNYAILFVGSLVVNVLLQPSALISISIAIVMWVFFLKKNEDPEWKPMVGGMELGPVQRWITMASVTGVFLLFMVGNTIFNTVLMYALFGFVHGIVHDPSAKGMPGVATEDPAPPL